jgi:hypothetical protein
MISVMSASAAERPEMDGTSGHTVRTAATETRAIVTGENDSSSAGVIAIARAAAWRFNNLLLYSSWGWEAVKDFKNFAASMDYLSVRGVPNN